MPVFEKKQQDDQNDDADLLAEINKGAKELGGERYPMLYSDGVGAGFVVIKRFTSFKKRLGKVKTFAMELMVVETDNVKVKPGAIRSVLEGTDKEAWDKRICRIIMAGFGATQQDLINEGATLLAQAYSSDQPMAGVVMAFSNVEARDKDGNPKCDSEGKPYVNSQFRAANAADWKRLKPLVAELDPSWKPSGIQPGA